MNIELISHTPDALHVAFAAIRTCYSNQDFQYIWGTEYDRYVTNNNDQIRLVKQIIGHGHTSTLEHISFTFSITGISRACLAQLTRHRIASYSVRSQRYTSGSEFVDTKLDGNSDVEELYQKIVEVYDKLLAEGYKPEDARMILPQSSSTNLIMTMNLRSFMNFYQLRRIGTHAQQEIGELAEAMKLEVITAEPWIETLFEVQ